MTDVFVTVQDSDDGDGFFVAVEVSTPEQPVSTFSLTADQAVCAALDLLESAKTALGTEEQVSGFVAPWMDRLTSVAETWMNDAPRVTARTIRTMWRASHLMDVDSSKLTPQQVERLEHVRDVATALVGEA